VSRDRGSATIWLVSAGFVVVTIGLAATLAGAAAGARHRAQAAADLGALAGAWYVLDGTPAACAASAAVVQANRARQAGCRVDGLDLVVTAEVPFEAPAGAIVARATARAGPTAGVAG
jgi:secretion/DNA translocation related TadE-like protein